MFVIPNSRKTPDGIKITASSAVGNATNVTIVITMNIGIARMLAVILLPAIINKTVIAAMMMTAIQIPSFTLFIGLVPNLFADVVDRKHGVNKLTIFLDVVDDVREIVFIFVIEKHPCDCVICLRARG